ncbi:MAG: tetraacyldisaccharide 4'-kinase [Flavobacteriaceae bacterium]|nr:tetraacyldisaccharide 4'-kinase [Flavobacteriaceae bacterium]MDG1911381.1 tetraacyldisaccharide 4'-kinase [Flavobacteriaceae bacterium]
MKIINVMLYPFGLIYGLILKIRNRLFDVGILKEAPISMPSIGVGNLSSGGTGKSVVVDYLITLLKHQQPVVVLSRGYKRTTQGVVMASAQSTAKTIGDEPFQFMNKHPEISVVVAEKRILGIHKIEEFSEPNTVILLDDVMQHRYVKPSLMILTTTFNAPFFLDQILPVGNLRESRQGAKRADIILVTKCPKNLNQQQIKQFCEPLILRKDQQVFFTKIQYGKHLLSPKRNQLLDEMSKPFVLVTGIADPKPLVAFLKEKKLLFKHLNFPDHHNFSSSDIERIQKIRKNGIVVTTEKDFTRLSPLMNSLDLYYLPITMEFINPKEQILFDQTIRKVATRF